MPTPVLNPPNLNDAIEHYRAGATIENCARECGLGKTTFRKRLSDAGVPVRSTWGSRGIKPTPANLVEDFLSGESVKSLATRHGLMRPSVYRMLAEAGIDGRDRSTAMAVRWSRATAAQRAAMLDRTHEAVRGVPQSVERRVQIAEGKAGRARSPYETALAALLASLSHDVELGTVCGKYNIDLTVEAVAVEVFGGGWHNSPEHRATFGERSRHILDAGYQLAVVWVDQVKYPLNIRCAQHLDTLVQISRGHPSIRRQHWVIRGDGKFLAAREDDGDEVPFITASGRRGR